MSSSVEDVVALFRAGEFGELVRRWKASKDPRGADPTARVLVAQSMAILGELVHATELVSPVNDSLPLTLQARSHMTLGLVDEAAGALTGSTQHFQAALNLAKESGDVQLIAWTSVHLFNHLVNGQSWNSVMALLPDTRRAVIRAGDPQATAYLHQGITVLEGQIGRVDEALRHCDLADSMLAISPNAWIASCNLLNRVCIELLTCRYHDAARHIETAKRLCDAAGLTRGRAVAEGNLGHALLNTGAFKRALRAFHHTIDSPTTSTFARLGALEGAARAHLALGELEACESLLNRIEMEAERDPKIRSTVNVRWSAVTKARLLLKQERINTAISHLMSTEASVSSLGDKPLEGAIHLTLAQSFAADGNVAAAAEHLAKSERMAITQRRELQAQFYYGASSIIEGELSRLLADRANRLWAKQGIVSVAREMANPYFEKKTTVSSPDPVGLAINALGAAIDLGHAPDVLGHELVTLLVSLGIRAFVKLEATSTGTDRVETIELGRVDGKRAVLHWEKPSDGRHSLLLTDVIRIGQAAVSLERVRAEEKRQAALWPADPIETEAGALFLAEEMQALLTTARRIAPTTVPVLITGETGTGKEVLARLVHAYSTRAKGTFLPFNCSAVPKEMLDSQLFGHRRGSFTGAADNFQGVIRAAAHGTLFLDEIGETTLDVQPKLLRFLESSEVHPIGELHPARVDVRVIAATNADLDGLVSQGRFREDLFYRLNIVRLHIPPLRERRVEIPALANHYLRKTAQEYGKGDLRLSEETMEYLVLYRWPGNVRQLANEMRRLAALAEAGAVLMPEHLSLEIASSRRTIPASERTLEPTEVVVRLDQPMAAAVQHVERALILHALRQAGSNMEETAALLGLSRKGLYLKRQRYGIDAPGESPDFEVA
jgi:DNA-binding NtrC family response regulator/tetratricopeptide (TPR) repeat protein